jgi:hypothetical protein
MPSRRAVWVLVAFAMFNSGSDAATRGLDEATGYVVTALFLITAVPALALIIFSRAPRTALTLALTFLAAFTALFTAAIMACA